MFDLENAIKEWRRQMLAVGIRIPEVLDELEGHLRDEVEQLVGSGAGLEEALKVASSHLGEPPLLGEQFQKAGRTSDAHGFVKRPALTLAGIREQYLDTAMNTSNSNLQPAWATYVKAAAFLLPAVCLWSVSAAFVVPKLNELCGKAHLENDITVWHLSRYNFGILFLLKDNWIILTGAIILILGLLELRSSKWPRYRRATIGVGAFLLNAVLLVSFFIMIVTATLAASELYRHVR